MATEIQPENARHLHAALHERLWAVVELGAVVTSRK